MKYNKKELTWERDPSFLEAFEYTQKKMKLTQEKYLDFTRLLISNCIKHAVPLDTLVEYINNEDILKRYRQRLTLTADEAYKRKSHEFGRWAKSNASKNDTPIARPPVDIDDIRDLFEEFFHNLQVSNSFFVNTLKIYLNIRKKCNRTAIVKAANSVGILVDDETVDKYIGYMLTANVLDWDGDDGYVKCLASDNNKISSISTN